MNACVIRSANAFSSDTFDTFDVPRRLTEAIDDSTRKRREVVDPGVCDPETAWPPSLISTPQCPTWPPPPSPVSDSPLSGLDRTEAALLGRASSDAMTVSEDSLKAETKDQLESASASGHLSVPSRTPTDVSIPRGYCHHHTRPGHTPVIATAYQVDNHLNMDEEPSLAL